MEIEIGVNLAKLIWHIAILAASVAGAGVLIGFILAVKKP